MKKKSHISSSGALNSIISLHRLTVVAVDPDVPSLDGETSHDVVFVGTSAGRVLKMVSMDQGGGPVLVEAVQVFPKEIPVRNVLIAR